MATPPNVLLIVVDACRPDYLSPYANVVGKAYTRFDVFLLGWVGLTSAVGYYEVALSLTALATLISGVVMDGLISTTSNLASRGRSVGETIATTISYTSIIAIPMFVLAVFLGDVLVEAIYGSAYLATVPFLVGIAAYRIVQTQREPLDSAVKGLDHPDAVFRISSLTLVVNLALGIALVVAVGAVGVVAATVVAELFRCALLHRALRRNDEPVPVLPSPLKAQLRSAAGMAAVLGALTYVLPETLLHQALVAGSVSVGVYLALFLYQDGVARRSILGAGAVLRDVVAERTHSSRSNVGVTNQK